MSYSVNLAQGSSLDEQGKEVAAFLSSQVEQSGEVAAFLSSQVERKPIAQWERLRVSQWERLRISQWALEGVGVGGRLRGAVLP